MARKPLRSQLNQIRAWVRQGRTDAWIAHQLEVSATELREFRRRHGLTPGEEAAVDEDLRDEIEAEIEAATLEAAEEEEGAEEEAEPEEVAEAEPEEAEAGEAEPEEAEAAGAERPEEAEAAGVAAERPAAPADAEREAPPADQQAAEAEQAAEAPRRRRRRRRRRRGRGGGAKTLQATFDHGEEGIGLWLDPAIAEDAVYTEHWAGHRPVEVSVEPDRITIRRSGGED